MLHALLTLLFEPDFFTSEPVRTAMIVGGGAAVVSGVVGVFTVIRGQSFAGHALADVTGAGGSAAFLLRINPLLGFLGMALLSAGAMEFLGVRKARERDLVTGIVMGAGLGLTALLLYFDVTRSSTTGAAVMVIFGSMFTIAPATIPLCLGVGAGALITVALLYRPLLLSSLDPDLAEVRGVRVRLVGLLHLAVLALAVSLSAMTIGAILSTALLVGPAAIAMRLAKRPGWAVVCAAIIGLGVTWGGILVAFDSYYWTPGHGWPVSFCVVALIFLGYLGTWIPLGALRVPGRALTVPQDPAGA
jgi:zinc/manganese transport system permease protein